MFRSQCPYLGFIRSQLCRIRLSGQYRGSQNLSALLADEPGQIGQRSALADEVVDQLVRLASLNWSIEERLIGQPCEAVGPGVPHGIQLHDRIMDGQPKAPRQLLGQGHRDFIHALRFEGMDRDQNDGSPAQHHGELLDSPITDRIGDQRLRRQGITDFRGTVLRMAFDDRFRCVEHDVRKIVQRNAMGINHNSLSISG